jgi:anaerobic dimethyl sulfoxide reductase subunit C
MRAVKTELEVLPVRPAGLLEHAPLVLFTLGAQASAGASLGLAGWKAYLAWQGQEAAVPAAAYAWLLIVFSLSLGFSLLHLGSPGRAYRALANLRTSWLSREIAAALLFGGLLVAAGMSGSDIWMNLAALAGLGLILVMARAYRLRAVAAWDTPLTLLVFLAAAGVLGGLLAGLLLVATAGGQPAAVDKLVKLALLAMAADGLLTLARPRLSGEQGAIRAAHRAPVWLGRLHLILLLLAALTAQVGLVFLARGFLDQTGLLLGLSLWLAFAAQAARRVGFYGAL